MTLALDELTTNVQLETASGQNLIITCSIGDVPLWEKLISRTTKIRRAPSAQTILGHSNHSAIYSRFNLKVHGSIDSHGGLAQILEVVDAPPDRSRYVIHEKLAGGDQRFSEWAILTNAIYTFSAVTWSPKNLTEALKNMVGLKKIVHCGPLTPWFFAQDNEQLIGDYAVTRGFTQDPIFRLGKRCVTYDEAEGPVVKTCVGCKVVKGQSSFFPHQPFEYRVIYFSDGSTWTEDDGKKVPRPLSGNELWVAEALGRQRRLILGQATESKVHFLDSTTLVSKISPSNFPSLCNPGKYKWTARVADGVKPIYREKIFVPTPELPSIIDYIKDKMKKEGEILLWVKIREKPGKTETDPQRKGGEAFFSRQPFK